MSLSPCLSLTLSLSRSRSLSLSVFLSCISLTQLAVVQSTGCCRGGRRIHHRGTGRRHTIQHLEDQGPKLAVRSAAKQCSAACAVTTLLVVTNMRLINASVVKPGGGETGSKVSERFLSREDLLGLLGLTGGLRHARKCSRSTCSAITIQHIMPDLNE